MEVTSQDLKDKFGTKRGTSLFISIRRANIGRDVMRVVPAGNRHCKTTALRSVILIDLDIAIKHFEDKLTNTGINVINPSVHKAWRATIKQLKSMSQSC